jgi:integrase/recombinase XerD
VDSNHGPGAALVTDAADADPVTRLVLGWLAAKTSEHTRVAYARDVGITPQRRSSRAPSWLAWCRAEGVHPVAEVTGLHVARYARQLQGAGLSPASVARKLAAISGWYAWLARRGHIAASPALGISRPRTSSRSAAAPGLTRDQAVALVRAADRAAGPQRARTAALVAVLLLTGARVSEVIGADVEDLGIDRGRRVLWVTRKYGRRQALTLPGPAAFRIDAYLAQRADLVRADLVGRADVAVAAVPSGVPDAPPRRVLFATETGGRLFAADVWRAVRRISARAGLPPELAGRLGPREMRHSFASLYLDAGGSLRDLQSAMGLADLRATRQYDRSRRASYRPPGYVVAAYLADPGRPRT